MATLVPENSSWFLVLKDVADKWNKVSGGKVRVILYAGGRQGDDPDVVRKMNLGTLNAGVLTSVGVAEIDKSVYALGIPMAFDDYEEVYARARQDAPAPRGDAGGQGLRRAELGRRRLGALLLEDARRARPTTCKKLKMFSLGRRPEDDRDLEERRLRPASGAVDGTGHGAADGPVRSCSARRRRWPSSRATTRTPSS